MKKPKLNPCHYFTVKQTSSYTLFILVFQEEKHQILTTFGWLETVSNRLIKLRAHRLIELVVPCLIYFSGSSLDTPSFILFRFQWKLEGTFETV